MTKTHYSVGPHGNACGRASARTTTNVYAVTCLLCQGNSQFVAGKKIADDARKAALAAQVPHGVREPWREGDIACRQCGGELFRNLDRTCYGHYDNWACAACGHVESRLTETGMSF